MKEVFHRGHRVPLEHPVCPLIHLGLGWIGFPFHDVVQVTLGREGIEHIFIGGVC